MCLKLRRIGPAALLMLAALERLVFIATGVVALTSRRGCINKGAREIAYEKHVLT
jgi:hypothetical protein